MVANLRENCIDLNHNMVDIVPIIDHGMISTQIKTRRRVRTSIEDVRRREECREMQSSHTQDKFPIFFSPPRDRNESREPIEAEHAVTTEGSDEPLVRQLEEISIFRTHYDSTSVSPTFDESFWTPKKSSLLSLKRANPIYDSDSDDVDESQQHRESKRVKSPQL